MKTSPEIGGRPQPSEYYPGLVSGVVLVLVLLLVARMRRSVGGAGRSWDECELSRAIRGAVPGGDISRPSNSERSDISISAADVSLDSSAGSWAPTNRAGRGTPDVEPPPAYHDLHPHRLQVRPRKHGFSLDPMLSATEAGGRRGS